MTSRIASAIGTFILPIALNDCGLAWSMGGLAAVLALGAVGSVLWAPETKDTVTTEGWVH